MPHYHVRVGDLQGPALMRAMSGAPTLPPIKAPKAAPAKAPKAPVAKPPTTPKVPKTAAPGAPRAAPPGAPRAAPPVAAAKPRTSPFAAPTRAVQGVSRTIGKGTELVRRGEEGVNRLAEFGEQFSGDSGGRDQMGHYHFNIPSRGSRMSQDYGTSEGAQKRNSTQSHSQQAAFHRTAAQRYQQAGNQRAAQAHAVAHQAHGQAWRNPSAGNSAHAWGATRNASQFGDQAAGMSMSSTGGGMSSTGGGMSSTSSMPGGTSLDSIMKPKKTEPYLNESTPKSPFGKMRKPTGDTGTSEGAKKAAQTRRQGSNERSVRSGGNYGVDIKAGVNTRQVQRRPDPEPYRGYDSRRK